MPRVVWAARSYIRKGVGVGVGWVGGGWGVEQFVIGWVGLIAA
jgi:hypothetical protein